MDKEKVILWDKEWDLKIVYDCYDDEEVLPSQKEALNHFLKEPYVVASDLDRLKAYCIDRDKEYIDGEIDDIFRLVTPAYLYIPRKQQEEIIGIMCEYEFDIEHGLALVYKNKKLSCIDAQDILL